jgi:hypothetical protein
MGAHQGILSPMGWNGGLGDGWGHPTPIVGLPPSAFMAVTAPYPPGFVPPAEPLATDASAVTVVASRPTPSAANAHGGTNGHSNGNGKATPTPRLTSPANTGGSSNTPTEARLANLVVRAESSIDELERLARTALDATAASSQAATDLQERLRLGVRMLQAFDVQIQRCEQTNSHVASQLNGQVGVQMAAQFTNQIGAVTQQCEMRLRGALDALEHRMNDAVPFLDERLRQAHDQVGRIVEERLGNAERRIEDRYGPVRDDLRRYADELATSFAKRLDAILDQRVNERIGTLLEAAIESRLGAIRPVTSMSPETIEAANAMEARLRGLLGETEGRLGAIDASLGRADARLSSLIRETTEAADGLLGTLGTAATLKDLIGDEARASRRLADEAHATSREHQREMEDLLERCSIARSSLDQQLHLLRETAAEADGRITAAKALRGEIEETLHRIAPIESALRPDSEPMQNVVESISSNVRQALAEDMRSFSQALRGLAARADHAFETARFDEFSPMPDLLMSMTSSMDFEPLGLRTDEASAAQYGPAATTPVSSTMVGAHGDPATDAHTGSLSTLPVDTRRLTAEIMALDATTLLRARTPAKPTGTG